MQILKVVLTLMIFCQLSIAQNVEGKSLLIYTKNGTGYVHDNIEVSVNTLVQLCEQLGVKTTVSDIPDIFLTSEMESFDAVFFSNTNNEAFDTEEQRNAFKAYCESGKGFGGLHSATGSERKWPWFWNLIGASFLRHPPYQEFTVEVVNSEHPATQNLGTSFTILDECYFFKNLNPNVNVLLKANLASVAEGKNNSQPRPTEAPLSWYTTQFGGRQWYSALGHSKEGYENPVLQEHLKGGLSYILSQ